MHKLFFYTSVFSILFISISSSQNIDVEKLELTGNFKTDSKIVLDSYENIEPFLMLDETPTKKSPLLAGVMSAILPGSGEFYVGEYLKAAIFFAVEIALISTAVIYDNKGDDLTAEFETFADKHWNVVKYSENLLLQPGLPDGCNIQINPDESLPPWERIVDWNELNHCESGFSHRLPMHGKQQYYELIGKYNQYSSGWDAFNPATDGFRDVPQIMKDYAIMRGEANDAYNVASKAVVGIYINHLLSAIDAVWSATKYNENIAVKMRVQNVQLAGRIEFVPTLNIRYTF